MSTCRATGPKGERTQREDLGLCHRWSHSQRRKVRDMPVEYVESHKLVTSGNETKTLNKRCAFFPNKKNLPNNEHPAPASGSWSACWCAMVSTHRASSCAWRLFSRTCLKDVHHRHVEEFHQKEPNRQRALPLETVLCWGMGHMSGPSPPQRRFFRRTVLL